VHTVLHRALAGHSRAQELVHPVLPEGIDPEQLGMSPADQVERLISTLEADFDNGDCREPLLDFVVMDASRDAYQGDVSRRRLDELGAQLITSDLIDASADGPPRIDPLRLAHLLLSLT